MSLLEPAALGILSIVIAATAGVIVRPFGWPEYRWAVSGAALLVILGFISFNDAWGGVLKGLDVYLFLTGMMILSELARLEGLFDTLAAEAARLANGSAKRLFLLIYAIGTVVTIFLSNDATAVVLTPAVVAVVKAARVQNPLPYLLICAFIANAASFVLPISNPANLVIYGSHMPALPLWLLRFGWASAVSIGVTLGMLYWTQKKQLQEPIALHIEPVKASFGARLTGFGILLTTGVLLICSALNVPLGLPTFLAGLITALIVLGITKRNVVTLVKDISWNVLPLVAGLFVLVAALDKTGLMQALVHGLNDVAVHSETGAAWGAGVIVALACNLMNNLPAGLITGTVVQSAHVAPRISSAALIGIDLGPNLSITGSLATILWLNGLRREGYTISAWAFLRLGVLIMLPALLLSLLIVTLQHAS